MNILNYSIAQELPSNLESEKKVIINTINPHSYCMALKDEAFKKALQESDYLLPDGVGIVWATKVLKGQKIKKIAGYDVFIHLMQQLNQKRGTCFFLGAASQTLEKITARAAKEYPNVKVHAFSPPYKAVFSHQESHHMSETVNAVQPDVLFVGMTAPKQEKWVHQFKEQLNANTICSIGAVFDFYAGTIERPSQFWIKFGLEWLRRFLKEPRRLAKRNLISTPTFIVAIVRAKYFGTRVL